MEGDGTLENWRERCADCGELAEHHWCSRDRVVELTARITPAVVLLALLEVLLVWAFMCAVWYEVHA